MNTEYWFYASMAGFALAIACVTITMGRGPVAPEPRLGLRGLKRQKARRKGGLFVAMEPAIRKMAGWISFIELGDLRRKSELLLMYAGDWLGLSADELIASVIFGGLAGGTVAAVFVWGVGFSPILIPMLAVAGGFLVVMQVKQSVYNRRLNIGRLLPSAIDIIALCMSAGLDFGGALAQIVKNSPLEDDPLTEEFGLILYHLQLGHSRSRALQVFAARVPIEAVSDFVYAVIQAEAKGSPLRETLRIQATMLRNRRSVRAEELAAKAGTQMVIPMGLLLASILLLIGGPLGMKLGGSGLF